MEGNTSSSSNVSCTLSASNRKYYTKGKKQKDCNRHSSNDEEYIGQPKVILTNVLRTTIGRKYTQMQSKTGANFSDAGKLRSDQPPSSSAASIKIWQILNPTLQSLFLSKRQPKVILTNVLRTKIGRKYIDSHVIIDANLSAADKLQSGQLPSSTIASLQTCQILNSPHESSFLSERSDHCLKTDDDLSKLTKASKEPEKNNVFTSRRQELQKKENKSYDELKKRSRNMKSTTVSQKQSASFDSEKRKRRSSGHISDDCNAHIPEKSLLLSKEQQLSSSQPPGISTPCEDGQDCRSNAILVPDGTPQPLERDYEDTSKCNHLRPAYNCLEESGSESPSRNLSEKHLSAKTGDVASPQVSTIRKLTMDTSQYLSKLRNRLYRGNRQLVSVDPIVLSSDDEDRPSEPKCAELLQNVTDSKETDQQSDFGFSTKQLQVKTESNTEQFIPESIEDKYLISLPSGSTPQKQTDPSLALKFDSLYIGKFNWLSTGPARFTIKYIMIPFQVALNKNINLTVDTLDLRRFGMWRSDSGCSSKTIIFLWLSVDYVEKIEIQLGKLVMSKPSKSSEFVFLELSQPLTEWEEDRLTEVITGVSKKNRAPDLLEFMSLQEALSLFKDLSPKESSFINYSKDLLKQCIPKQNASDAHESAVQESKPKVSRPSYALANKQNSGCYSISLSSALNEEWKEVRETGAVKNLIVYPPPPAKGGLGVTREDLECLEYGEFLNDVIIDFYLKYLLLEKVPKHLADRTHIFSSFFYKCLTRTEKNSESDLKVPVAQRRHRRVRTWTRHINIFNKDYIFVPVNEESHWYIAVICFPRLEAAVYEECSHQSLLCHQPQQSPLRSESENTRSGSVWAIPGNCSDEEEMVVNKNLFSEDIRAPSTAAAPTPGTNTAATQTSTVTDSADTPAPSTAAIPPPVTSTATTQTPVTSTAATQTTVIITAAKPEDQLIPIPVAPVHKRKSKKQDEETTYSPPGTVSDQESSAHDEEEEEEVTSRSRTSTELRNMRKDFICQPGEHIITWLLRCWDDGADGHELEGRNEIAASASVLHSAISKISLSNSKRQICKRPCILILDSLKATSVQKTVQVLREYLEVEWEAKRKMHREFNKSTMIDLYPRVPKQDNSSDCGIYLLQYVESFFENPIVNFEEPLDLEKWFPRQLIRNKREEIRDLILQLHFQQHSGSSS